ncbi:fungal-specific transcription factor [Lasiosphaeria miniovina]|uniref:Fungal-specific transcription factor n=1 Tax=Lasiosphaeria miniovina TaxID=1954250 RepID=A0AA40DMG2_9PEZI|nr:fungal-specific transcription factor [Lasiosphaeria miniovina]KAK0706192.1 fungal-specific transcription factor [Lasiosphaeria miniovina]
MATQSISASPPSSPPSSPEQAAARPIACLRCRNRRSYCSKEKPKCSRCRDGAFECIYEEARKIAVSESYLRALEAKVKAYEGSMADDNDEELEAEDDHVLLGPFTQLSIDKPSTSFKGPGSSDYFLRNVRELSGVPGDDSSLDLNPNFYDPGALPSRRLSVRNHVRLPPFDIARRLFAAQYTYIGTIFAFNDPAAFDLELLAAYRGQPDPADKDACLAYAKVLATLAFGQLYSVNQWIDFKGPPGFEYFTHALQLLPDAHEEGSILCVETLALVGYFMQNMNRRDAAFLYIGMALRMAISLGLHQEVSSSSTSSPSDGAGGTALDAAAREHRRRVWWSIYSLDRILSVKSGNPTTIQDDDIGVQLPSQLPSEPTYCPAVVLRHYTQLSRILGDITTAIYRKGPAATPRSGRRLMASVQRIIQALSRWDRDLPDELRFNPAKLAVSRESVSTFSHYYQCINMTARPLLFHVVQRRLRAIRADPAAMERADWKDGLSQTTVRVIDMCVAAAHDTIHMMVLAAQRDLVATYGYMDGEHVFSAAIVLVLACAALPPNATSTRAMNAGLGLLRAMAERGNSHMGTRYELLAHLRSAAAMMPATPAAAFTSPAASLFGVTSAHGKRDSTASFGLALAGHGDYTAAAAAAADDMAMFVMADAARGPLPDEPFLDDMGNGTDFMLWEEGFANPALDAGYDLTQWTQGA